MLLCVLVQTSSRANPHGEHPTRKLGPPPAPPAFRMGGVSKLHTVPIETAYPLPRIAVAAASAFQRSTPDFQKEDPGHVLTTAGMHGVHGNDVTPRQTHLVLSCHHLPGTTWRLLLRSPAVPGGCPGRPGPVCMAVSGWGTQPCGTERSLRRLRTAAFLPYSCCRSCCMQC
jgi:hypothetical protein